MTVTTSSWGRTFDPDRLAQLELRMWKAYYRRQPIRLLGLLILANREQARAGWLSAVRAAFWLAKGAVGFGRSDGAYERFVPDVVRGYRALGLPADVDIEDVARRELRWWVVRREIGLAAGSEAGAAIARLYSLLYHVPESDVAEAGRLRGLAAEVRDRGATADPDGPKGAGAAYWPEVAQLLRDSYRSLHAAVAEPAETQDGSVIADAPGGAANDYHFVTVWRLPATPGEIVEILGDAPDLARWWPSVYLDVRELEHGDETGRGKVVDLYTKGWLPYTLRWQFRVTESTPPTGFTLVASGDFVGRGVWTITVERPATDPAGPMTLVQYDWRVLAEKGILKTFSLVMKPIFSANHHWAMRRGLASITLELARRRAHGDAAILAAIPAPPAPTFPHNVWRRHPLTGRGARR